MAEGIRAPNLPLGSEISEFLGIETVGTSKSVKRFTRASVLGAMDAIVAGFQAGGGIIFTTKAQANASLNYDAMRMAWVVLDPAPANNGVYQKSGASGSGAWTKLAELPYSFYRAVNEGAGTANAIKATNGYPMANKDALIVVNITDTNTSSDVTLSLNDGPPLVVKTAAGNDPSVGGFVAGMLIAGYIDGPEFRLITDQASAAIQAAAEAAQAAAEAARDIATGAMSVFEATIFSTLAVAEAYTPEAAPDYIKTVYYDSDGDAGSGSTYRHGGTTDPSSAGQLVIVADGVHHFYVRSNRVLRPEQHGCKHGGDPAINRAALLEMFALADATGREIDLGTSNKVFVIPTGIEYTWQHNKPVIRGSGATIKLDKAGGSVSQNALYFGYDQLGFDLEGFNVDANYDAPYALNIVNTNAGAYDEEAIRDGRIVGVGGHRGYTRTSLEVGTRGINITGWLRHLLAQDLSVDESKIADGAYDINFSTAGIFIGRDVNGAYALHKEIINPFVRKIWSEDGSQILNLDALMIFDAIPGNALTRPEGTTTIRGGMLRDYGGRGVKAQASNIDVFGLSGELNSAPDGDQVESFIDFQFGGGNVVGGSLRCNGFSPKNIILGQSQTYACGQTTVTGFQYYGTVDTPEPDCLAWYIPAIGGRTDGGLVVQNCHTRVGGVKNIARFSTRSVGAVTERAAAMGNSMALSGAGIAFEFFNNEQGAGTFKDNFNLSTNLVPLYTRKDTSGNPVTGNTVTVNGSTNDNWYFSAGT